MNTKGYGMDLGSTETNWEGSLQGDIHRRMGAPCRFSGLALVLLLGLAAPAWAASWQGLGDLPGGSFFSLASAVSSDGSVVVGWSDSASGVEAFRWTSGGGMVGLGDLAGGIFQSDAHGVSSDGSVVVGGSWSSLSGDEAFRWTSGGGMVGLGDLAGGGLESCAYGVSSNGSVVVGYGWSASGWEAFRWTSGGGMVGLGDLAGGSFESRAYGVSSDGLVVVGRGTSASGWEAFRWTSGGGMVGLGDLAGGSFWSHAFGVSSDGSVVVGFGNSASGSEAFRWTSGGGMVGLGDLAGGSFDSSAFGVSSDGSVVVGRGNSASGYEAFIWDAANGMRSLKTVLTGLGVNMTGWTLTRARGISADGLIVMGYGTGPSGSEAWVANLDATPPTVSSVVRADADPTNASSVDFTVTFSESVTGVDTGDFTIDAPAGKAVTGASVTDVSGSGDTYTVTVDTGSGDGFLSIDLTDDDSIIDDAGNPLGGSGAGNGDYTTGEAYTVAKQDTDGDGIPDLIEGSDDPDGDGLPNYLDDDSDGDGIPDSIEGYEDPDEDGTLNFLDDDSDADGAPDGTEWALGTDPYDPENPTLLPIAWWPVALALFAVALTMLRSRRKAMRR